MPDPKKPTGVDYWAFDTRLASGTEVLGNPQTIDWLTHADQGVRFAFLQARHALLNQYPHVNQVLADWFNLNYPLVKNAGILRAPYFWLDPCRVQIPANLDNLTTGNMLTLPFIDDPIDFVLQQAADFCDQILAQGWGEPGDLPPAVDVEPSDILTSAFVRVNAVVLDNHNHPIFERNNGTLIGGIVGNVVIDPTGTPVGNIVNNAAGHPVAVHPPAGPDIPGRLRRQRTDLWQRVASPQDRINLVVVWLAEVERRLTAAVPGRPAKPVIYSGGTWRELLNSPDHNNGGVGWNVNHNGVNYHVDDFAQYKLWFAQYPNNPVGANHLVLFPTTWATVGQTFIWQYAADPDINVLVRITNVAPDPHGPAVRIVTVEEVNDLSELESLAGIVRPAVSKPLTLVSPAPVDATPGRSFNLLVLGQGFDSTEFPEIAQRLWTDPNNLVSITDTAPFGALHNSSRVAVYSDDGTGVFLRMRQIPSNVAGLDDALSIPSYASTLLRDYLPLLKIIAADGTETTADKVWLQEKRQAGPIGALIAILRNGRQPARNPPAAPPAQRPAELYQLDPSENYPVPVVAVNVTLNDELWPLPIVRALAQDLGALRDEFELPGDGFDHPALELVKLPMPNLIQVDGPTRDQLAAGGAVPAEIIKTALEAWRLPAGTALDFVANGTPPGALGGTHLVEGGNGYRHQMLRSDFDCLMRRMPVSVAVSVANAVGQPIRAANIPFCRVCREWLEAVLRGGQQVHLGDAVRLDTQRILYDWITWQTREDPAAGYDPRNNFHREHSMAVPEDEPQWSMTVDYHAGAANTTDLFSISAVKLNQRPGDPYARAVDILRLVQFNDLSINFTHRERPGGALINETVALNLADALANTLDPPQLTIASNGGTDRAFQLGIRLTLSFPFIRLWPRIGHVAPTQPVRLFTVEVVLGLVLTGEQYVDSTFPVRGCKIMPQFAMRVRRDSAFVATGKPRPPAGGGGGPTANVAATVHELKGSLIIEAVNAIPSDNTLDPALAPIATGLLGATFVTGSNRAMGDSQMAPVANDLLLPSSGRKLAGLHVDGKDRASAFRPFLVGPLSWSWRYDYVRSLINARTTVAGSYRDNEPKGAVNTGAPRDHTFTWPAGSTFQMDVFKFPRQGDYDALYIHPIDNTNSPVLSFPASGDLGLSLIMRQGASESTTTFGLPVLGWGPGSLESGARTSVSAPLVPPNQHVDLIVEKVAGGVVRLTYTTSAQDFRANDWQVFLEQGLGIGYYYDATGPGAMDWLKSVSAFAGIPDQTMKALAAALADKAHPSALDIQLRTLFRTLHSKAHNYDPQVDSVNAQQAPEAGDIAGAEAL